MGLLYVNCQGEVNMVDVSDKVVIVREVIVQGILLFFQEVFVEVSENCVVKGDVLVVVCIVGI